MNNHDPGEYRERSHGSGTREEKRSPENARVEFLKTPAYRARVDGRSMMSYIIQCIPCKRCYRISVALGFPCGRAKIIRVRYVWTHICSYKNLRVQKYHLSICGRGLT